MPGPSPIPYCLPFTASIASFCVLRLSLCNRTSGKERIKKKGRARAGGSRWGSGWQADKERGRGGWQPGTHGLCQALLGWALYVRPATCALLRAGPGTRALPGLPPCPQPPAASPGSLLQPQRCRAAGRLEGDRPLVPGRPQGRRVPPCTSLAAAIPVPAGFQACGFVWVCLTSRLASFDLRGRNCDPRCPKATCLLPLACVRCRAGDHAAAPAPFCLCQQFQSSSRPGTAPTEHQTPSLRSTPSILATSCTSLREHPALLPLPTHQFRSKRKSHL